MKYKEVIDFAENKVKVKRKVRVLSERWTGFLNPVDPVILSKINFYRSTKEYIWK